jgi:hypothetical protein
VDFSDLAFFAGAFQKGLNNREGRVDLLSVIMHELGHVLGLDHEPHGPMEELLPPGTRRRWDHADGARDDDSAFHFVKTEFSSEVVDAAHARVEAGFVY